MDKTIKKIIYSQLVIKLGLFNQELDVEVKSIKNSKAASLDKNPPEKWKKRKIDDLLLR